MSSVTSLLLAGVLLAAGTVSAMAGPSCAVIGGKSFVFLVESVENTGIQDFERSVAGGRFTMRADGLRGQARYVVNGPGEAFAVRDQRVICEGDDGLPPRLTLFKDTEASTEFRFRPSANGELVLEPFWPNSATGRGTAVPQAPASALVQNEPCRAFTGKLTGALVGEDTANNSFQGAAFSELADYRMKAGTGASSTGRAVDCVATDAFGVGAARLGFTAGSTIEPTSGAVYAASRDRILYIDETPGRTVVGWFYRR